MGVDKLRKFIENICHLISALTAADVNNNISVRPFCKLMLSYGLSASERSGNSGNASLCNRKQTVDYTLTGYKRHIRRKLFPIWSAPADRPFLHERKLLFSRLGFKHAHGVGEMEFALFNLLDRSDDSVGNHDFVEDDVRFGYCSDYISADDLVACTDGWSETPHKFAFK